MPKTEEVYIEPPAVRNRWFERKSYWYNCGIVYDESARYFEIPVVNIEIGEEDDRHIVRSEEAGRLDLISYKYYGNTDYWWVIAIANDIYFPFDVKVGDVLVIPSRVKVDNEVIKLV